MNDAQLPAPIDRPALERILQRAAELQAAERDIGEGLTSEEVLALGKEVGIPARYLQQAMLEDRTRAMPVAEGWLDQAVGPGTVSASRVVRGTTEAAERALLDWMQKQELMALLRQQPGMISWERMGGVQAAIRRGFSTFDSGGAKFMLDRADAVRAVVTGLEDGYVHVTLTASLRATRGGYIGGAAALSSVGAAGTIVLVALQAAALVAAAPVVGGAFVGWVVTRRFRPVADRTHLGLERALDYVEGTASKPVTDLPSKGSGLLELLTGEVRRAITAASQSGPSRPGGKDRR